MRVIVRVLGTEVLAVDTGCDCPAPERPRLEAGPGGSFDFGFTTDTTNDVLRIGRDTFTERNPPDD